MELSEELKYRLSYLTLRLFFDHVLAQAEDPGKFPATLQFLDVLAGTDLAGEEAGRKYASQRAKLESFLDAEYDEEMLALINKVVDELA